MLGGSTLRFFGTETARDDGYRAVYPLRGIEWLDHGVDLSCVSWYIDRFDLKSTALYWIITYAGLLIFVGLIARNTQKTKQLSAQATDETSGRRIAILGSLMLYLDFINLFMLRIFGRRD